MGAVVNESETKKEKILQRTNLNQSIQTQVFLKISLLGSVNKISKEESQTIL